MTQPTPPNDRQFTRDVARQIDRRRVRRRVTLWSALLALVAAGAAYLRCGGSFGLGGLGGEGGFGDGGAPVGATAPRRCAIRVSAAGLTIDGRSRTREQAIAACKTASAVDLFPTGDVRHGDLRALGEALAAAGAKNVEIHPPAMPGSGGGPSGH